ncbi:MAG: hypothetical protein GTO45_10170 [Candidatus Aminicenantes bacterium]|nr:hypothetical protein [Candidatus Aminicenantes bacterium]NIM79175.1 hypothetical protein [Candidatus Aminicenantes bacterium]NIN18460.1 hypothetical protein [Candidatus Aminicenantes bacterium]NIN42348.1 hypothetical protein [Candidatus Aminicenantes bacterium]NIN85114.1 hypothetical protein [Candidatus Aminicenantes bacterium]
MQKYPQKNNVIIVLLMATLFFVSAHLVSYDDHGSTTGNASQLLKKARKAIFMKEWKNAIVFLEKMKDEFPGNQDSDSAVYWLAYSQNKLSQTEEKKEARQELKKMALKNLDNLIDSFENSDWVDDAKILRIEIAVSLIQSGNPQYKKYLMDELENLPQFDSNLKKLVLNALNRIENEQKNTDLKNKAFTAPENDRVHSNKLLEEFLLLSIDDKKGKFFADSTRIHCGIAGTIIYELIQKRKIVLENNKIILKDESPTKDIILDQVLKLIKKRTKQKSLKYWVKKISKKAKIYKKMILYRLIDKKILTMETGKVFIAFNKIIYPSINPAREDQIKIQLNDIILHNREPDPKNGLLISLIYACKLRKTIFKENEAYSMAKKRLKEIYKKNEIGVAVRKAIKQIKAEKYVYIHPVVTQ